MRETGGWGDGGSAAPEVGGWSSHGPLVTPKDVALGWILFFMLAFGALVGLVFPWTIAQTVEWRPGQELTFRLACVAAGLLVGGFAYGVARFTLYRTNRHLARLAVLDPLTGLANQRFFFQLLRGELSRSSRQGGRTSLIVADLDHFKHVNDTHGHLVGNDVLSQVGAVLTQAIRAYDTACRIGGEEFAVILPDTDEAGARVVADRIRVAVASIAEESLPAVTVSVGIAVFPDHAATLKELVARADDAMYAAKDAGRNATRVWDLGRLAAAVAD